MANTYWRRARGGTSGSRVFAAYLALVLMVAMVGPGLAVYAAEGEDPGAVPVEMPAAEPVVEAPAVEEPVSEPVAEPAVDPTAEAPAVIEAAPLAVVAAAALPSIEAPVVTASVVTPSASVTPVLIPGNPALGDGGIKIDPPAEGTFYYGDVEVNEPGVPDDFVLTIDIYNGNTTFSFTSNYPITQVIVKGGDNAYAYNYPPPGTYGDSGLISPLNNGGNIPALSHMMFYFGTPSTDVSIVATKFHDDGPDTERANGTRDSGAEEWLGGFVFELYSGPDADGPWTLVDTVTSVLPDGKADFGMQPLGWYKLVEVLTADQIAAGWYATTTGGVKIFEASASCSDGLYIGNLQEETPPPDTGDLVVYKFEDLDESGHWDAGEPMLENWAFSLYNTAPAGAVSISGPVQTPLLVSSGLTDVLGELFFAELPPGTGYSVTETLQDGWTNTTPLTQPVTIVAGQTAELWFGNIRTVVPPTTGDLVIHKYNDLDEDGVHDDGEPPLQNWEFTVVLEGPQLPQALEPAAIMLIGQDVTNAAGELSFLGLSPDIYTVTETPQTGWDNSTPLTQYVEVVADQTTHVWFGNFEPTLPFTELDLAITKAVDDPTVVEGQLVTYTLTYWNNGDIPAEGYSIVDDFDERYLTIVDPAGGIVAGGKITWLPAGSLAKADGKKTITYTARVIADMPDATTNIDNVVVITHPRDSDPTNNSDDARVVYTPVSEPFLPFTGGEYVLLLGFAVAAAAIGLLLRLRTDSAA